MGEKTQKKSPSTKRLLTDFLVSQYGFLTRYFYIKLAAVAKGTYPGLPQPIPVEHLYDMWQQKMPYLNKVNDRNERRGKTTGSLRADYDLAILLSLYPSYLKWKESVEIGSQVEYKKPEFTTFCQNVETGDYANVKNELNIESILNDLEEMEGDEYG